MVVAMLVVVVGMLAHLGGYVGPSWWPGCWLIIRPMLGPFCAILVRKMLTAKKLSLKRRPMLMVGGPSWGYVCSSWGLR